MIKWDALIADVINRVKHGAVAADAVDRAWQAWHVPKEMYSYTRGMLYSALAESLGVKMVSAAGGIEACYGKLLDDRTIRLQVATTSARMRQDMAKQVKDALKSGEGLWETSRRIREDAMAAGADSATAAEKGLKELYGTPLEEQAKVIARRLQGGIKTDQLRYSYEKLVDAAESVDPAALVKQQEYTIKAKLKSHGERIYRTEKARAVDAAKREQIAHDPHVQMVKIVLESGHDTPDICDAIASADCGFGPGVYPLNAAPCLPLHPNCECRLRPVYRTPKATASTDSPHGAYIKAAFESGITPGSVTFLPITKKL